jgi:tripartite-type tricarboxylate transporter receptor subunit TctC
MTPPRLPSRRRLLESGVGAALLPIVGAARAATPAAASALPYPAQPVRLVVAYAAGGGADFAARLVAQKLQETAGIPVVVENRPGAAGVVGTEYVARSPGDGHTLLFADAGHGINAAVYPTARYHPVRDFTPLTLVASSPQLLAAHPSVPADSLGELLALPRAQTQAMGVGTTGQGSGPHLTYELLRARTGLRLIHVPYKGGGPAINDAVGGQIPLVINSMPACMPHLQSGRLKPLALATAARHPRLPEVQTFAESARGVVAMNWYGVLAPAHLPPALADRLTRDIGRVLELPEVREKFAAAFLDPMPQGGAAFARFLEAEVRKWKDVVAQTGAVTG